MTVHWCLRKISGTIGRGREQIKLVNYPRETWQQISRNSKLDDLSLRTLNGFPHLWICQINSMSNSWNHLSRTLRTCSTHQEPWDDTRWPHPIPRYWCGWDAGCGFCPYLPPFPDTERKRGNNGLTYFSLILALFHPNQLSNIIQKKKNKTNLDIKLSMVFPPQILNSASNHNRPQKLKQLWKTIKV